MAKGKRRRRYLIVAGHLAIGNTTLCGMRIRDITAPVHTCRPCEIARDQTW